jgi:hypothetical protein
LIAGFVASRRRPESRFRRPPEGVREVGRIIQVITIALALFAGLGFVGVYGWEITKAWTKTCPPLTTATDGENSASLKTVAPNSIRDQAEDIKDPYTYVATVLVGLVGGVVAVLFGQRIDLAAVSWKELLSGLYAIAYTLMGVASVVTWMFKSCESVLVKSLALSFLGLLVPVVTAFFKNNSFAEVMGWKKAT